MIIYINTNNYIYILFFKNKLSKVKKDKYNKKNLN